ncbi:LysR family transcriptional regulator [Marinobacterium sedimentorum]|uniref:LysR family transcriptional regulator n=1 Tax=Marinobacterium sedimentorum TaxID=2927804 RepID=UPI0020C636BC|nr:LysR family transcriptional regulator [Marinobacterium sedimentorum]MCP8687182.1 LysR family transcriptional regulator [Marinobacterium sedimentorum]
MSQKNYSLGQVGDFEIKQLRIFKAVVDNGGFSAAETELNINRSTISIHISNLESRLNLSLCRRGRGGFALTPEGRVIYEMTRTLLDSLEQFRDVANEMSHNPAGELRIVVSDGISLDPRCRFPEMIGRFCDLAPEMTLHSEVAAMADIERIVLNDEANVGLTPYHRRLDGLNYIHLYSDTCRLYCGQAHPLLALTDDELTDKMIDGFTAIQPGLKLHEEASQQLCAMSLKATAYFYETRLALILSGKFIAFLPEAYAEPYVQSGQLKRLGGDDRFYTLGIAAITKKRAKPNRLTALFLDIIQEFSGQPAG